MDAPSYTPPAPVQSSSLTISQRRALLIGGAVVLIALLAYGGYRLWESRQAVYGGEYVLAATSFPPHAARHIGGEIEPLQVEGQGSATLYDMAYTETHAYYLLSGPEASQSTLYRRDLSNPDAGLEQLTTSSGLKIDLSMIAGGAVLAYTVEDAPNGPTRVVVWQASTKSEKSLGVGSEPTVLGDGEHVLFRRGNALLSANITTGEVSELASIAESAPFAADRATSQFAVYDPADNAVKSYWLENMNTVSEGLVTHAAETPEGLVYRDGTLLMARMTGDTLTIGALDGTRTKEIPAPGLSLMGLSLTPHHD